MLNKQTTDNDDPCVEHTGHNVDSGVTVEVADCHRPDTWSSHLYINTRCTLSSDAEQCTTDIVTSRYNPAQ